MIDSISLRPIDAAKLETIDEIEIDCCHADIIRMFFGSALTRLREH
jgi:hypothetical protein